MGVSVRAYSVGCVCVETIVLWIKVMRKVVVGERECVCVARMMVEWKDEMIFLCPSLCCILLLP